ncbi:MAG: GIY-YIG nuclease family protein [Bacteroidota bacterium]
MATVYILYSKKLNRYYTGSCLELDNRMIDHIKITYKNSYTSKSDDWELYLRIDNLEYKQARFIETHIKKMKSKSYIQRLKEHTIILLVKI